MTTITGPDCAVICNSINTHTHTHTLSLQRVPTSGGRDESNTSSAAILFCFTAGTFIPHASPSLQTGGGACEHPAAPFVRHGVCTRVSYRVGNRTESERREGANGVGGGIGVGGGNGNGNGVGGGNEDVNGDRDGDGAGAGAETGVEANEGAKYGNGDGSGAETGRERGRGWRPGDEHRMGARTGARTETRAVAEIGTGTRMGPGTRTGSGRAEKKRRSARNRTRIVDAIRQFYSAPVIIPADKG